MTLCPIRLDVSALTVSPLPLDLTLVKQHVAEDSTDNDDLLEHYTLAAILWAEGSMRRTIYARSHTWVLKAFPRGRDQTIRLPRGKTQSIESIAYSSGGAVTTLTGPSSGSPAGTDYQEDLRGDDGAVILPARGAAWSSVDTDVPAPVVITFTAGWLASEIPQDIIHGLLFSVADAFDVRGTADMTTGRNFETREALISPYRLHRWY